MGWDRTKSQSTKIGSRVSASKQEIAILNMFFRNMEVNALKAALGELRAVASGGISWE